MTRLLWVCFAGGVGTGARYLVNLWAEARFGSTFPIATLIVNLVGCLLLGVLMQLTLQIATFPPGLRLVLGAGFLGGLTTYSSFNTETLRLVQTGEAPRAALYFGLTIAGCLLAGLLGMFLVSVAVPGDVPVR